LARPHECGRYERTIPLSHGDSAVKRFSSYRSLGFLLVTVVGVVAVGCRPSVEKPAITVANTTAPLDSPAVTTGSPGVTTISPGLTAARPTPSPVEEPEPMPEPEPTPEPEPEESDTAATSVKPSPPAALPGMEPLPIELPAPAFRGTPVPLKEPKVQKPRGEPRPPFFAPAGTVNLALGKPVTTSDPAPAAGEIDYVTDGDKEASDFGYLEIRPGTEWIQIDLGEKAVIYAVLLWHNHAEARVYRDVVVQVSDDPDFLDARTVFNNDYDNSSGLGIGPHMGYVETSEGKLIDCKGVEGRYVRLYGRGNNIDEKNHYTEVEVFGKPVE